jgi:type I restriction enzyme R subunit
MSNINENTIEQDAINLLQNLGYAYKLGSKIEKEERESTAEVVLKESLSQAISRLNPHASYQAKDDAIKKILRLDSLDLNASNQILHKYLTNGVDVEIRTEHGMRGDKIYLIDFNNPNNNQFLAVNQFTIIQNNQEKRLDIILFVNGLPLVVIELKNAFNENATLGMAYNQLQDYKQTISDLFIYNSFCIISDGLDAKYGTITSQFNRFMQWHNLDNPNYISAIQLEIMLNSMCNKHTLLDMIRHFIVFEKDNNKTLKKISAYHQYYAVQKAVKSTVNAINADKRIGVVWHTQGSGKSLSMVFYAGKLAIEPSLHNPTLIVLTDRNDLDDQLYTTFSNCKQLLRQSPKQAQNRTDLKNLLNIASGGIIFTTIQKFDKAEEFISDRKNIIVIADEAHRSQYDFIDGFAKNLRDALPNAAFIGFTGTPIESTDKNTRAVFGDYIDVYDIQQAVKDKATVPIYYEGRLAQIYFNEQEKIKLDNEFEELTESEEQSNKKLKAKWARLEAIIGNPSRIENIAKDLVYHFEQRTSILHGKAMVVCMSRRICVDLYNAIIKLKPDWHSSDDAQGAIKVIMTGSKNDELVMQPHIRDKFARDNIAKRLKDPSDPLKIVIVRDMWLTGFDAPCLHTLYVDKPMQGHNLMQAIARVNRVFSEYKSGGLVVDYIGIAQELKYALMQYTNSGGKGEVTLDQELAVAKMLEFYEAIESQLRHFDWKKYFILDNNQKLRYIQVIMDYIYSQENGEQSFIDNLNNLLKAFALSVPHEKALKISDDIALFQLIKTRINKISDRNENIAVDVSMDTAIKQILSKAIVSQDIVDIFDAAGIKKPDIQILDDKFLEEVKNLPQKNLAVELLKRLLKKEIKQRTKVNLVEGKKFSQMLEDSINRYHNKMVDTVEFLEEILIPFARQIKESERRGEALGLDYREYAFYTALETSNSAVAVLGDDILKHISQDLLNTVRNSATVDWTTKDSVQADLRRNIRRILNKYGYPPDLQDNAVNTVLEQAKLLAQNIIAKP